MSPARKLANAWENRHFGPNNHQRNQRMSEVSKEQEILMVMRKVLASIIKDTTPPPGMKHPMSDSTIEDVRACLALISARERELADAQGRVVEKPYYTDQRQQNAEVVPMSKIRKPGKD
jgi:hypothetical protein